MRHAREAEGFDVAVVEHQIAAREPLLARLDDGFDSIEVRERDFLVDFPFEADFFDDPAIRQTIADAAPRQNVEREDQQRLWDAGQGDQIADRQNIADAGANRIEPTERLPKRRGPHRGPGRHDRGFNGGRRGNAGDGLRHDNLFPKRN